MLNPEIEEAALDYVRENNGVSNPKIHDFWISSYTDAFFIYAVVVDVGDNTSYTIDVKAKFEIVSAEAVFI